MATLSHHLTLQLSALSSSHHYQPSTISFLLYRSCFHLIPIRRNFDVKESMVCCVSTKKSSSRKLMSDVDLCNSIRQFVASVGLPEGHVPSTKELAEHGRKDLANIVRRRGHKFIKELLASSSEIAMEGFDLHNNWNDEQNGIYVQGTGQYYYLLEGLYFEQHTLWDIY
uniref:Uncharacterized protein n=1 Tax=Opuntia streptacantha TaxID=393608 RepID=A0A7C9AR82_OPUST